MSIRNWIYTKYRDIEVEVSQNPNSVYNLIARNGIRPDESFQLAIGTSDVFVKSVSLSEIENAFDVNTYADYKGKIWQVDRIQNGKVRLSTSEDPLIPEAKMVDRHWYEIWVNLNDIDKIWEERKKSSLNLPYPAGLPAYQELDINKL